MLESFPFILLLGTILGFLSGLGIGGGSLLILWLTFVLGMEHGLARGINLLFFLPCATISCLFRWKQGAITIKKILPAMVSGCLGAALFSWLGGIWTMELLKKLFGVLLIFVGLRELFYRPRKLR